jgi:phenylacetate-CoA ligase
MKSAPSFRIDRIGSIESAQGLAQRAHKEVSAYRQFLREKSLDEVPDWDSIPVADKKSYILSNEMPDLMANSLADCFCIFSSAGTSGGSAYWPLLRESYKNGAGAVAWMLDSHYSVASKKTLFIVAIDMDSWMGGEHLCWVLKNAALDSGYPMAVFPAGQVFTDVLKVIGTTEELYDQFVIVTMPSLIGHIHMMAAEAGVDLPLSKIKYLVSAEPMPEDVRVTFREKAGIKAGQPFLYSIYGSADTGALGAETVVSIAARELLTNNEALAEEMGIQGSIPHLFHCSAFDGYLECIDNELVITRWQGIPLVRYNLHDAVEFFAWEPFQKAILASPSLRPEDEPLVRTIRGADAGLPALIALSGRADACLILGGANLFEYQLDAAVRATELSELLTGVYKARVIYQADRQLQQLEFDLELKADVALTEVTEDFLYSALCKALCRITIEFETNYHNFYKSIEADRANRVIQFNLCHWPRMSEKIHESHKHRGLA